MSRKLTRRQSDRRGASVVELAFVAPVFFLLIFGIIEVSRAVMLQQSLTDAARAAARTASLATTANVSTAEAAAQGYLRQAMTSSFNMSNCQVSISPTNLGTATPGTEVSAKVSINYNDVSWVVPSFMKNITLEGNASMTKE